MLSAVAFIKEKRKILASLLFTVGILSALIEGMILVSRPQTYRSKAADIIQPSDLQNIAEFTSPKNFYKLPYNKRYWTVGNFGQRVVFNLNKEYGSARLDIIEGESTKDLDNLKDEIVKNSLLPPAKIDSIQFKGKPSYLISYKENIIGEDIFYDQLLFKENNQYFILEKRVPKFSLNQSLLDNLLQSISFVSSNSQIKGVSNPFPDLTTVELVDLVRPSVISIVNVYCLQIVNLAPSISGFSKPQYNFCGLTKGSGFIVTESGVVATNGHVVKIYPEESLMTNLLNGGNKDFTADLIRGLYLSKGQLLTQSQIEDFYQQTNANPHYLDRYLSEILRLVEKKILALNISEEKYYVNVGDAPIRIDHQKMGSGDYINAVIPSQTTYTAKLLDFDFPNRYSFNAVINKIYQQGSDVALLQITNSSNNLFPALELGNTHFLKEGSDLIIAGYPILVEGADVPYSSISYKTSTKPTFTRGIVSAVKQDPSNKKIFQTDASIDHGNSGGPAFNLSAEVIGIASFQTDSQSGNFNFLRDVEDLKELMSKNSINNQLDEVSMNWREGLAEFRDQHFSRAIKYFKKVEKLNPTHPSVKEFIRLSEEAITRGENLEGLRGYIGNRQAQDIMLVVFGAISIVSFMSAGFLTALPLFERNSLT